MKYGSKKFGLRGSEYSEEIFFFFSFSAASDGVCVLMEKGGRGYVRHLRMFGRGGNIRMGWMDGWMNSRYIEGWDVLCISLYMLYVYGIFEIRCPERTTNIRCLGVLKSSSPTKICCYYYYCYCAYLIVTFYLSAYTETYSGSVAGIVGYLPYREGPCVWEPGEAR